MSMMGGTSPGMPPPGGTTEEQDAYAIIKQLLDRFDLGGLTAWAWSEILAGASTSKIQMDLYEQQAFKDRFPVIQARLDAGLPPVSPMEVVTYEDQWRQLAISAGMPPSFLGRDIAQAAMTKDISVAELQSRVNDGYVRVAQHPELAAQFDQYFGTGKGNAALASVFIDPDRALPDLERMVAEADLGASAHGYGFDLSEQTARGIFGHGVSADQGHQGFAQLDQERQLLSETIDEKNDITTEQGVEAVFGMNETSAEALRRRAAQRQSQFTGSDTAAGSEQKGITGLGSAKPT